MSFGTYTTVLVVPTRPPHKLVPVQAKKTMFSTFYPLITTRHHGVSITSLPAFANSKVVIHLRTHDPLPKSLRLMPRQNNPPFVVVVYRIYKCCRLVFLLSQPLFTATGPGAHNRGWSESL